MTTANPPAPMRARSAEPDRSATLVATVRRAVPRRRALWALAVVTALVVVTAGLVASPLLAVKKVEVIGAPIDRVEAVQAASGIEVGDRIATFLPGRAAAKVRALPWVEDASVTRHLPDRVTIRVVPRTPVGYARDGERIVVIDGTGRVLYGVDQVPGGLPELTGLRRIGDAGGSVEPLAVARAAAGIGADLRIRSASLAIDDGILSVQVVEGPKVRFGEPRGVRMKARVAGAVIATLHAPVTYVDVSVPAAPVSG